MNTVIIFCFLAFAIGASQADAGGKYCRMKWQCHNVVVHKCNWRIQNVCRNNCRRVDAKVAEHVAARLGVAGALHYHRGLQSVHVGAVRGQGLGRKVLVRGGHGKFGHGPHHYHWGFHGKFGNGLGHYYWGVRYDPGYGYGYNGKYGYGLYNGKYGYGLYNGKYGYGYGKYKLGYGYHNGYGNGKYGSRYEYHNGYGHGKYGYHGGYGIGKYGYYRGYGTGKYGYGKGYHGPLGGLRKHIYYDPSGPITKAKNQLCVKVCHKEPRKSCWDAKELKCKRTGKKICLPY